MTTPIYPADVLEKVKAHAESAPDREIGGVLVGTIRNGNTHVEAHLPALKAIGHRAQVTFTHDVWEEVLASLVLR